MFNAGYIKADCYGWALADQTLLRWRTLWAAHLAQDPNPDHHPLAESYLPQAVQAHAKAREQMDAMFTKLERLALLAEALPNKTIVTGAKEFLSREEATKKTNDMGAVAELASALRGGRIPKLADPKFTVADQNTIAKALALLRATLPPNTQVHGMAQTQREQLLIVTAEQFAWPKKQELLNDGKLGDPVPLDDIRYVRFKQSDKGGPVLDVITKDDNLRFVFDARAAEGPDAPQAEAIANVLKLAMHIPDEERPEAPRALEA